MRRGRHRVPAPAQDVARVRPAAPDRPPARRHAWRATPPRPALAQIVRTRSLAPSALMKRSRASSRPAGTHRAHIAVRQHRLAAVLVDRRPQPAGDQRRAPRPSSRGGTRPRPSRRCGSADAVRGRRRRRDRGSSTPSRTGSPQSSGDPGRQRSRSRGRPRRRSPASRRCPGSRADRRRARRARPSGDHRGAHGGAQARSPVRAAAHGVGAAPRRADPEGRASRPHETRPPEAERQ